MEELFEELKHHRLIEVNFTIKRYEIVTLDGEEISTSSPETLVKLLRSLRTAPNHDARADDSEGGCREYYPFILIVIAVCVVHALWGLV